MVYTKSKRIVGFLLALAMLFALSSVFCFERAHAAEYDGEWQYEVTNGKAVIISYIGTSTSVKVPAKVNNIPVVSVRGLCSSFMNDVKSINFSSGIQTIETGLCKGYAKLESVTLPDTLTTIGASAFESCTALRGIIVPNSVSSIGHNAFAYCTAMTSADLTCKVSELSDNLFYGDIKLNTLTLPSYITSIGVTTFGGCESLTSMVLPDTVKTIGVNAFGNCTRLREITLSTGLRTISERAFAGCTSLTKLFIPNSIQSIYKEAFVDCTSLREVYICPSIAVMKDKLFDGCVSLEKVVFGGDYININNAFATYLTAKLYYPVKYASNWSSYTYISKESYEGISKVTVSVNGGNEMSTGTSSKLKIVVAPSSCPFKDAYILRSSNPNVVSVSADGTVTARATGSATITVYTVNGVNATCKISVKPDAPTGLEASPKTTTSADLTWNKVYNASGYLVFRSTSKNGTYKQVGKVSTNSYTDTGLSKGKTYYYKIKTYVNSGSDSIKSNYSVALKYTASAPAPTNVSASKTGSGTVTIKWGKSNGANGYEVYMATSQNGKYSKIATINSASTLSYKKTGLSKGKTYYFKVCSYVTVNGNKIYSPYTKVVKVKL